MKFLFKYILFFLISPLVLASMPTEEGLFRNGDNADIKGDLITYKLKIHSIVKEQEKDVESIEATKDVETNPLLVADSQTTVPAHLGENTNYIKVIIVKKGEKNYQYLFLFYSHQDFSANHLVKILPILNPRRISSPSYSELTRLNIGLLQMLTLNRSTEIVNYIKSVDPTFKRNTEVLNKDKSYLYARYKRYLQAIKKDPELKLDLENPKLPEDKKQREAISKIEAMPMYLKSNAISLQKNDNTFMWSLNREHVQASFDQRHLFLTSLFINSLKNIRVNVENFILYDGVHQLPSKYIIDVNELEKLTVSFLSYRVYPKSSVKILERIKYYSKQLERQKDTLDTTSFVNLLYQSK